jgi:hypothetical protein
LEVIFRILALSLLPTLLFGTSIDEVPNAEWESLNKRVEGRLKKEDNLLFFFQKSNAADSINNLIYQLQNPFTLEGQSWATHATGMYKAWETATSPYVIQAMTPQDISEGVKFAKKHGIRLVIKGTGHDYLGRSNSPDSLLIWTHLMRDIKVNKDFKPIGSSKTFEAVTVEAGTRWGEVYQQVTTLNGKYVQGGGCTSVGACGGFFQSGGFGSYSKRYGTAASNLLEAEVVLASGEIVTANNNHHPDLFWALKGGGGGTFGVVTKATFKLHQLPENFGVYELKMRAPSNSSYKNLILKFMQFYKERLFNSKWGEQAHFYPNNRLEISLSFLDLSPIELEELWSPFLQWLKANNIQFTQFQKFVPSKKLWDLKYLKENAAEFVTPDLTDSKNTRFWWSSDQNKILNYFYTYLSHWLPKYLLNEEEIEKFSDGLYQAAQRGSFLLNFDKGLSGCPNDVLKRQIDTSMHPICAESFALMISAASEQTRFPGLKGFMPNPESFQKKIEEAKSAYKIIKALAPESGTYFSESDYFEENWKQNYWGENYPRLLEIKKKYDPDNLFRVHHGVGSDL